MRCAAARRRSTSSASRRRTRRSRKWNTLRATLDALGDRGPPSNGDFAGRSCAPRPLQAVTLVHRDFRTGNYMVDARGPDAVLDWEFAAWGDPMAGYRLVLRGMLAFRKKPSSRRAASRRARHSTRGTGRRGLQHRRCGRTLWEVMAHLRWAVIALEQGHRHLSGQERSLELALTGRIAPELERTVLRIARFLGKPPTKTR